MTTSHSLTISSETGRLVRHADTRGPKLAVPAATTRGSRTAAALNRARRTWTAQLRAAGGRRDQLWREIGQLLRAAGNADDATAGVLDRTAAW